ncbi:MAG: hypothetical protein WCS85_02105 [Candidatus Peribacteraceae bacterium]|jgi:uncharacterized protein YpuA (DUF1002 family)
MTDESLRPLQDRITKIDEDEKRLNRDRLAGLKTMTDRRAVEKRKEATALATVVKEEERQEGVNAGKERAFQADLKREGEVTNVTEALKRNYIVELRRREEADRALLKQINDLETQLQHIRGTRP